MVVKMGGKLPEESSDGGLRLRQVPRRLEGLLELSSSIRTTMY